MLICPIHGLYEGECKDCKKRHDRVSVNKRTQRMANTRRVREKADETGICPLCKVDHPVGYQWRVDGDSYMCVKCATSKISWDDIPVDDMCPRHGGEVKDPKDWVVIAGHEAICRKCHKGYCWKHMHKDPCIPCDTEKKVAAIKICKALDCCKFTGCDRCLSEAYNGSI